jgi:hypothetical protein
MNFVVIYAQLFCFHYSGRRNPGIAFVDAIRPLAKLDGSTNMLTEG